MSVQFDYWAIPPSSTLFQRLLTDKAFVNLMAALFPHGPSVFFLFDSVAPYGCDEILGSIIESGRLGNEAEARRLIDEFRLELEQTRLAYPGIGQRRCSLEKSFVPILERISEALRNVPDDSDKFVTRLMTGDHRFLYVGHSTCPPDIREDSDDGVGLVPSPLVQEGARLIGELNAEALFAHELTFEDFKRWHGLYRDAAALGEAILVGLA
jgi:hypothetical protein